MSSLPTQNVMGLVSGMDTRNIIDQYMQIERRSLTQLENRKLEHEAKLEAYRGLNSLLLEFNNRVNTIAEDDLWDTKTATSSNESLLSVVTNEYAQPGSYSFRIGRMARTAQYTSAGFADHDSSPVAAGGGGEIRIDSSKSLLQRGTKLSLLNGGQGVYAGKIRVTDKSGNASVVDLSTAETMSDVIDAINKADGILVEASLNIDNSDPAHPTVAGDALVISDISGGTGTLRIENYEGSSTATDLGIIGTDASTPGSIQGSKVHYIGSVTPLSSLRDGLGINDGSAGMIRITDDSLSAALSGTIIGSTLLDDLNDGDGVNNGSPSILTLQDDNINNGNSFDVSISSADTVQDVVDAINNTIKNYDPDATLEASIRADGKGIHFENAANLTISASDDTAHDLGIDTNLDFGMTPITGAADGADLTPITRGLLDRGTLLAAVNSGSGVNGGAPASITIQDDAVNGGVAFDVDLSNAATLGDVADLVNDAIEALDPSAELRLEVVNNGTGLIFSDANNLDVSSTGGGNTTAEDLGIAFTDANGTATGGSLAPAALALEVDLSKYQTVLGVVDAINAAIAEINPASGLQASIGADGRSIAFGGASNLTITSAGASNTTAEDLGIAFRGVSGAVDGEALISDMNSVQVSSLSGTGGTGINGARGNLMQSLGSLTVDDGSNVYTFDLSDMTGADSVVDVLHRLNYEAEAQLGAGQLTFGYNAIGNGIQVTNASGVSIDIADDTGTLASDLGLAGTVDNGAKKNGGDLDLNYISRATQLSALNHGSGVSGGTFRIVDAKGSGTEIAVSSTMSVGDVIDAITNTNIDVRARINDTGDGIVLEEWPLDASASGNILVEERGGKIASELGLLGSGTGGETGRSVLDGSFEAVVTVDQDDTLSDVMDKIADSGSRLQTSIINDGSEFAPWKLVVASKDSGRAGDFVLDSTLAQFDFRQTSKGQDALLLYGQGGGEESPVVLTSSTNINRSAVLGLTLDMKSVSEDFITVTVSEDKSKASEAIQAVVESYNAMTDFVDELDSFDADTGAAGLLFADSETRNLMNTLSDFFFTQVEGAGGNLTSFYDLGITFRDEGGLDVDVSELQNQINTNWDGVKDLMTMMVDVARKDRNASASANTEGAAGSKAENLINGNTDQNAFGIGNGFEGTDSMDDLPTEVDIRFAQTKMLDHLILHHVNTNKMPASDYALRDFTVEYLDASTGKWEELRKVTGNRTDRTYLGFYEPTGVDAVRIKGTKSNAPDNKFRLVEIEAMESQGLAGQMKIELDRLVDGDSGFFARQEDLLDDKIEDLDETMERMEEQLESREIAYIREFAAMEAALSSLTTQGDFFTQQMDALTASKNK